MKIKNKWNKTNDPDSCIEEFVGALNTNIISHLCDYSLGIYDCAQILHKLDNLPMDKWEYTVLSQHLPGHTDDNHYKPQCVGGQSHLGPYKQPGSLQTM